MSFENVPEEESLDPADWQLMRSLGHRMIDDIMTYLETIRTRPVWQSIPEKIKASFKQPLPLEPQGPEQAYEEIFIRGSGAGLSAPEHLLVC
jgi:hypothetical protein